jgi:hypothetical protein
VADSSAVRSRRYRQHKQGDHSLCRHDRPFLIPVAEAQIGNAVADSGADFDPAEELRKLAGRLLAAYADDPGNAALAREARFTLQAISAPPEEAPEMAEFFASLSAPTYPEGA